MQKDSLQKPKIEVSVIIPAFNAASFLLRAVESVLEQTVKNIEIIIVDDGSTDDTATIAKSFGDQVKYLWKENGGIASARNYGLHVARGEFIASLDADDYFLLPTKLERQMAVLKQFDDCGLVVSGWLNVDSNGTTIEKREPWKYAPRLDLKEIVIWNPFLSSVMLFRREALEAVGGFDPQVRIIEDFDIVVRLILKGYTIKWLPEITTAYRLHVDNTTRKVREMEREIKDYFAGFFLSSELPVEVKKIERKIHFSNRIRIAFRYFEAGNFQEMKRCLLESLEFSDLTHGGALFYWMESFRGYQPQINLFKLLDSHEWRELIDLQLNSAA